MKKLDYKIIGPFRVVRETGGSYKLDLPDLIKQKYPIFHPSLLRAAPNNLLPRQINQPPLPIEIEGEDEYEVDNILDTRKRRGKV